MTGTNKRTDLTNIENQSLTEPGNLDQRMSSVLGFMMNLDEKLDNLLFCARLILIIVSGTAGGLILSRV